MLVVVVDVVRVVVVSVVVVVAVRVVVVRVVVLTVVLVDVAVVDVAVLVLVVSTGMPAADAGAFLTWCVSLTSCHTTTPTLTAARTHNIPRTQPPDLFVHPSFVFSSMFLFADDARPAFIYLALVNLHAPFTIFLCCVM